MDNMKERRCVLDMAMKGSNAMTTSVTVQNGAEIVAPIYADLVQRYYSFAKKSAENIIKLAETLVEAKDKLSDTELQKFCNDVGLQYEGSTYKKLMKIGAEASRFEPFVERMPNNWTTLYKLAKLDKGAFDLVANDNRFTTTMTASEELHTIHTPPILKMTCRKAQQHGTIAKYTNDGCRCEPCCEANRTYQREYKRLQRVKAGITPRQPAKHGSIAKYASGCRCKKCREAHRTYHREWRAKAGMTPRITTVQHGSRTMYKSGCRCEICVEANRTYQLKYSEQPITPLYLGCKLVGVQKLEDSPQSVVTAKAKKPTKKLTKRQKYNKAYYEDHKSEIQANYLEQRDEKLAQAKVYRDSHKEERKAYFKAHRDEHKAERQAYYAEHRDEIRAKKKVYTASHKEERKAYLIEHKDEIREYNKAYYDANAAELRAYQAAYHQKANTLLQKDSVIAIMEYQTKHPKATDADILEHISPEHRGMLFDLNNGLLQQFAPAGGAKGISWRQKTKKWRAAIWDPHGKTVLLGEFADIKNAVVAWNIAAIKYYGSNLQFDQQNR
jgi:hypothetical protein